MLWNTNVDSVQYRYSDTPPTELPGTVGCDYRYDRAPSHQGTSPEPVQTLKAIACYEYQSCEHDGWEASEAHAFCEALRKRAIAALPGYDDAAWDIPRDHHAHRRADRPMRAIGYVRVSTEEQATEGLSLQAQEARLRAYCDAQEWTLEAVFSDAGVSRPAPSRDRAYSRRSPLWNRAEGKFCWS